MPQNNNVDQRIQDIHDKLDQAETEIAIINRDIEQAILELRRLGIDEPDNSNELIQGIKAKINKYNKRISTLLAKAENLIGTYERR
ncbi:MAG: hypothetical protein DRJ03_00990 [Chloroflexi bacterium]|nr:MAG: hypothetical protein DRJ03_00990 [Chloroflexota bacterium]